MLRKSNNSYMCVCEHVRLCRSFAWRFRCDMLRAYRIVEPVSVWFALCSTKVQFRSLCSRWNIFTHVTKHMNICMHNALCIVFDHTTKVSSCEFPSAGVGKYCMNARQVFPHLVLRLELADRLAFDCWRMLG